MQQNSKTLITIRIRKFLKNKLYIIRFKRRSKLLNKLSPRPSNSNAIPQVIKLHNRFRILKSIGMVISYLNFEVVVVRSKYTHQAIKPEPGFEFFDHSILGSSKMGSNSSNPPPHHHLLLRVINKETFISWEYLIFLVTKQASTSRVEFSCCV